MVLASFNYLISVKKIDKYLHIELKIATIQPVYNAKNKQLLIFLFD